jgi:hypothetical protein
MFALQNASLQLGFNFKEGIQGVRAMVFNATFNNISVLSWRSVLLVIEKYLSQSFKLCYLLGIHCHMTFVSLKGLV